MKWFLILLTPLLLFSAPQDKIYPFFGLSQEASQTEILDLARQSWIQQGKERWFFDERFESLREALWPLFKEMGMVDEMPPKESHYNVVIIPGALFATAERRIRYLLECEITYDQIVFLTGDRPLLDSEKKKLPSLQTEGEMIQWVYEHSELPKNIPTCFIVVPMQGKRRPNSVDTVKAWLETNPSHPETCLLISNQPYIQYQKAVLNRFLPFPIEAAGPEIVGSPTVALMLDTLGRELFYEYGDIEWLQK